MAACRLPFHQEGLLRQLRIEIVAAGGDDDERAAPRQPVECRQELSPLRGGGLGAEQRLHAVDEQQEFLAGSGQLVRPKSVPRRAGRGGQAGADGFGAVSGEDRLAIAVQVQERAAQHGGQRHDADIREVEGRRGGDLERARVTRQRRQEPRLDQRGLAAAARSQDEDKGAAGGDLRGQDIAQARDRRVPPEKHRGMRLIERIEADIGGFPGPDLGRLGIGLLRRERHWRHGPIAALADILDIAGLGGAVA